MAPDSHDEHLAKSDGTAAIEPYADNTLGVQVEEHWGTVGRRGFIGLSAVGVVSLARQAYASDASQSAMGASSDRLQIWEKFADGIKEAGKQFLQVHKSGDPVTDAEQLRYLMRLLARSVQDEMASAELQPVIRLNTSDISKAGLDAAECKYTYCAIDSGATYRVWGRLGTAQYISFQLYGYPTVAPNGGQDHMTSGSAINHLGLKPGSDGSFELMISPEKPNDWSGPWLKLAEPDNILFGREYFNDWERAEPSRIYIERRDAATAVPLDSARVGWLYDSILKDYVVQLALWQKMAENTLSKGPNQLLPIVSGAATLGQDELAYGFGSFKLDPKEALVIEINVPDANFWSIELGNLWWESIDFVNHPANLTMHHAAQSSDGLYRIVICENDPEVANWLDPAGHREGMILYRYFLPKTRPTPKVSKVAFKDLSSILPHDTKHVSKEERLADLQMRRRHVAMRFAP